MPGAEGCGQSPKLCGVWINPDIVLCTLHLQQRMRMLLQQAMRAFCSSTAPTKGVCTLHLQQRMRMLLQQAMRAFCSSTAPTKGVCTLGAT